MNLDLFRSLLDGRASDVQMVGAYLVAASLIGLLAVAMDAKRGRR